MQERVLFLGGQENWKLCPRAQMRALNLLSGQCGMHATHVAAFVKPAIMELRRVLESL